MIQTHLKKLFAGIHSVQFDQDCSHITAMKSLEGEVVPLKEPIAISTDVEVCAFNILAFSCYTYMHACTYIVMRVYTYVYV